MAVDNTGSNERRLETDIPIVQSQRNVWSSDSFVLRSTQNGELALEATVYSSDSPPFSLSNHIEVIVDVQELTYQDIIRRFFPSYAESIDGPGSDES
jgi:hypothetical protein